METKPSQSLWVSLLILVGLVLGIYWVLTALIDKLNAVNSDLGKAIVAGFVAVVVAAVTLVAGKLWEQHIKIQQDVREKKVPVYEQQLEAFFAVMFAEKLGREPPSTEEVLKAFVGFTEKLIIWGGPGVIKAWTAFRMHPWDGSKPQEGMEKFEQLIRAIRTDLGSSNSGLATKDLMGLLINDVERVGVTTGKGD